MPDYICEKCNFFTHNKYLYNRHLKTKKHLLQDISNVSKMLQIECKSINDTKSESADCNKYICNYCNKSFNSRNNMYRHRKHYCKEKKKIDIDSNTDLKQLVIELNKKLEKYEKQEIGATNNITQVNNNQVNHNQINNNNQVNINNNINNIYLLGYKETDISHLTNKQYKQILNRRNNCIQEAIKVIHFDKNKPENMNIYISNMKNGCVAVYNGNTWELKDKELAIEELMDSKEILLEEWLEDEQDKYPELKEKFDYYLNSKEDNQLLNQMKREIELYLYNNKHEPINNRKKNKNKLIKESQDLSAID